MLIVHMCATKIVCTTKVVCVRKQDGVGVASGVNATTRRDGRTTDSSAAEDYDP